MLSWMTFRRFSTFTAKMVAIATKFAVGTFVTHKIMVIDRSEYVNLLMQKRWNGKVKIITGIRRCGKSYLLNTLFKQKVLEEDADNPCFVEVALDRKSSMKLRNPNLLYDYVIEQTKNMAKK